MSLSIPGSFPSASSDASSVSPAAPIAPPVQPVTEQAPFVIKLTAAEQVYQLSLQEMTVPQIASHLSLTVAAVNRYLGITDST